jgi:retinol dehydrogenase-12
VTTLHLHSSQTDTHTYNIGNIGLGKATSLALAKHNPEHIYLAARTPSKAEDAIKEIKTAVPNVKITFIQCDLASLSSVQTAAREFTNKSSRLDILINNAGVMALPAGLTADGYEIQFGTNHVGHALLTKLLLPTLLKTAEEPGSDVRVISLSSIGHKYTPSGGIAFPVLKEEQKSTSTWARYGQSKLANILHSSELARRYPTIKCVSVHPGVVDTNLSATLTGSNVLLGWTKAIVTPLMITPVEKGAWNQLWAATSPDIKSGEYYTPVAVTGGRSGNANNEKLARELWDWTENELKAWE